LRNPQQPLQDEGQYQPQPVQKAEVQVIAADGEKESKVAIARPDKKSGQAAGVPGSDTSLSRTSTTTNIKGSAPGSTPKVMNSEPSAVIAESKDGCSPQQARKESPMKQPGPCAGDEPPPPAASIPAGVGIARVQVRAAPVRNSSEPKTVAKVVKAGSKVSMLVLFLFTFSKSHKMCVWGGAGIG
jgi:hypothetical protein